MCIRDSAYTNWTIPDWQEWEKNSLSTALQWNGLKGKHYIADALSRYPVFNPDSSIDAAMAEPEQPEIVTCMRATHERGLEDNCKYIDEEYSMIADGVSSGTILFLRPAWSVYLVLPYPSSRLFGPLWMLPRIVWAWFLPRRRICLPRFSF